MRIEIAVVARGIDEVVMGSLFDNGDKQGEPSAEDGGHDV
jgi:hypothetical protein